MVHASRMTFYSMRIVTVFYYLSPLRNFTIIELHLKDISGGHILVVLEGTSCLTLWEMNL